MATSAKSQFNFFQNGKYGSLPQNMHSNMEVTQDMHLKMSKKIAQLTKVIYALNTKNDEHELIIQSLREQHEEEIQQLLAETKVKVELYKQKLDGEISSTKRIEKLEQKTAEYEKQKASALDQFEVFKKKSEERETLLKTEHAQQLLHFSKEVLQAKEDFQEKIKLLDTLNYQNDADRAAEIERLKEDHRKELEEALKQHSLGNFEDEKSRLEEKYKQDLEELNHKCECLRQENSTLTEDFEFQLNKAQAFYEKELAAFKEAQNKSESEQLDALREEQDRLRKDYAFQETQYKNRIDKLLSELSQAEQDATQYRNDIDELQKVLKDKESNSTSISDELASARNELSAMSGRLREVETDLTGTKERWEQQAHDLLRKSTEIGELEATRLQHESTIQDLSARLESTQERLNMLETRKRALESRVGETEFQASNQIKALEQALEDMSIEKQTVKERLERELKTLQETSAAKQAELISEYGAKMEIITQDHKQLLEAERSSNEDKLQKLREELGAELSSEREKLRRQQEEITAEFERVKVDLSAKLEQANEEVARLEKILNDKESGLGSATSQIASLKEVVDRLKQELNSTRNDLTMTKSKASSVDSEYQKLKLQHEAAVKAAETELKTKLESLASDLDGKWTETLRRECEKLRKEITSQKDEERRAEMDRLSELKDEQMQAAKQGWETKLKQLLDEISSLKTSSDKDRMAHTDEMDRIRSEAETENHRLRQEILTAADEYSRKIETLQALHEQNLEKLKMEMDKLLTEKEETLKSRHIEDMQAQLTAHKASVEMIRDQADKEKQSSLDAQQERHNRNLENFRIEMQQQHAAELDETSRSHQLQLQAARMELDRAIELSRQKDTEHAMQNAELEENIRHRQQAIDTLEEDVKRLQSGVDQMAHELEAKGKEILNIRSKANRTLRVREEQLSKQHKDETLCLQTDFSREKKDMLHEFQEAQSLLKDKIATMQLMLEEAEERYQNRESRPEDLEMIKQLHEAISQRELALKRMMDDKKFYQMELVNRETNFNKVFSASPNVGVLNPLNVKTRPREKGLAAKFSSSPVVGSANNRLDPLPNSPVHDNGFSTAKPLPPMKKFVK